MADVKSKSTEDLAEDIERLRGDISKLSETVRSLIGRETDQLKSTLADRADQLSARGRELREQALRDASAYERQAEETIARNPFTSIMIAAGVGFLFGIMSRGR